MKILVSIIIAVMISGCGMNNQANIPYDMTIANKGYKAMLSHDYDKAEAFFELALSVNPVNPYALLNLGVVYQNTGRLEEAKEMYQKVIKLNSTMSATQSTDTKYKGKTLSEIAETNLRSLEKQPTSGK